MRARRKLFPWFLLLPGFVAIAITVPYSWYLTIAYSLTTSRFFLNGPGKWNWFANYVTAYSQPQFLQSLEATLLFSVSLVLLDTIVALGVASILNRRFRGVGLVAALILLPWIMATVASSVMWRLFLDPNSGIVDVLLVHVFHVLPAGHPLQFLATPTLAWITLISIAVWKGYPLLAIIFLAAMKGVPAELNEVATMEGASAWQRFRRVTLPTILPIVILMNLFLIVWTSSGIEFVYTLTGGGPGTETMILPVLAYFNMFQSDNAGLASAQMVTLLVMVSVLLAVILKRVKFGGETKSL